MGAGKLIFIAILALSLMLTAGRSKAQSILGFKVGDDFRTQAKTHPTGIR